MTRDELIEVGAKSILSSDPPPGELEGCRSLAEDILDAVEPLIRADERLKERANIHSKSNHLVRSLMLADLRAKAEALPSPMDDGDHISRWVLRADVLNLIERGRPVSCPKCGGDLTAEMTLHGDTDPLYFWCLICGHRWPRYTELEDPGRHAAGVRAISQTTMP